MQFTAMDTITLGAAAIFFQLPKDSGRATRRVHHDLDE